jgi:hypothetical protein
MKNNKKEAETATIHICNLKRNLPHLLEGGRIYMRKVGEDGQPTS